MDFCLLSKFDDLFSDIFLDSQFLWFDTTKLNNDHRRPRIRSDKVLKVIQNYVLTTGKTNDAIKELLKMDYFKHYMASKSPKQQQEFIQHMKRYLYMYMPNAGYEIADTRRYGGAGRRVEACVTVTKDWHVGDEMRLCTGMIAHMEPHQEHELKKGNRDISVMWSSRKQCNCLFLGPARFVNHDCDPNAKFIALGQNSVTLKIIKEIKCGDEVTAYYGKHYFGENNCECRCATCETQRTGYFTPEMDDMSLESATDNEEDNSNQRRSLRKRKSAIHDDYITEHDRRAKRQSLTIPSRSAAQIQLEELIGYVDSDDSEDDNNNNDDDDDSEDENKNDHSIQRYQQNNHHHNTNNNNNIVNQHRSTTITTSTSYMNIKQEMMDSDDDDEAKRKVMSIHFLCNDQNDKKQQLQQQQYQHMTSPRLSPVTHSPLDLLCEVILDAEHIKIQQQEKEKSLLLQKKPKEITIVVSSDIHRDAADRVRKNGSYHHISTTTTSGGGDDDSSDTKADSAVGLSPRLQQNDDPSIQLSSSTKTTMIKKEPLSDNDDNSDSYSLFDDDGEQLSELDDDDLLDDDDDEELSSVSSFDEDDFNIVEIGNKDEKNNNKQSQQTPLVEETMIKKSPSPSPLSTTSSPYIKNENNNNDHNNQLSPTSPKKKGFPSTATTSNNNSNKMKKGSTESNDSLTCVACGKTLLPETTNDPSAADVAVANELATWTWSPSAAFTDWRPKRCPRCERHHRVFSQEWPSRKIKRSIQQLNHPPTTPQSKASLPITTTSSSSPHHNNNILSKKNNNIIEKPKKRRRNSKSTSSPNNNNNSNNRKNSNNNYKKKKSPTLKKKILNSSIPLTTTTTATTPTVTNFHHHPSVPSPTTLSTKKSFLRSPPTPTSEIFDGVDDLF